MNQRFLPVLAASLATTVYITINPGGFSGWSAIVGLVAAALLLSAPPREATLGWERALLAMVWSLAGLLVLGRGVAILVEPMGRPGLSASRIYFILWLLAVVVLYLAFRPARRESR